MEAKIYGVLDKNNCQIDISRSEKGTKELIYYEALFKGGNLYAFSITDLVSQLVSIYNFKTLLTEFNLN